MKQLVEIFERQIEKSEKRFDQRKKVVEERATDPERKADWRQIEQPDRVMKRMMSLGMKDLASEVMANDSPEETVESIISPDTQVSLLERIIEENELVSSRFLHLGSKIARSVGRILLKSRGRTVGYGTGFMISPRLLMTNNHVLSTEAEADRAILEFDYYERTDGQTGPTQIYDLDPEMFFETNKELDYTIVAVKETSRSGRPLRGRGWIHLSAESGKALIGEAVNIIQHPGGDPQQIVIKENEVTDIAEDFMHYVADTEPGSSGAPVLNMQWELAALHHSGVPRRDPQKRILLKDGSVWDETLASIDRIDWIANEGVRISSIVKAVREKLSRRDRERYRLFEEALSPQAFASEYVSPTPEVAPFASRPDPEEAPPVGHTVVPAAVPVPEAKGGPFDMDDETLDNLTPEEVAHMLAGLEDNALEFTLAERTRGPVLVAEGDSWFDYSIAGVDIIDNLRRFFKYKIYNVAKAGDTLDNMAWGTEYKKNRWERERPPLDETLRAVERYRPPVVLLSGGGNDVAGDEFSSYLNHKGSGEPPIRTDYVDYMIKDYFRSAFEYIFDNVWAIDDSIHFIIHGYGHPPPDGRGVVRLFGLNWVGPWLRPALTAKGYTRKSEREEIVHELIDEYNKMLKSLARSDDRGRIHYIDLRRHLAERDWVNELHLSNSAYRRVAALFDLKIREIVQQM